tara:strand:- start:86780 stop:87895 length:1116 start_codon:yes stop_codon:yes gene_type:complete
MNAIDEISLFEGYFPEEDIIILVASTDASKQHIYHSNGIDLDGQDVQYRESVEVYNYWTAPITAVSRDGVVREHKTTQRPAKLEPNIALVFKKTIEFNGGYVNYDVNHLLNDVIVNHEHIALRFSLDEEEDKRLRTVGRRRLTKQITYYIVIGHMGMQDITSRQMGLYIKEIDMLISSMSSDHIPMHPYATLDTAKLRLHTKEHEVCSTTYRLIDNTDKIGHVYIPDGNDILKVMPRKSNKSPCGLYVSKTGVDKSVHGRRTADIKHYNLDQMFELPNVFRTRDEAISASSVKTQRDIEEEALKRQAEKEKREHELTLRRMDKISKSEGLQHERNERIRKGSIDSNLTTIKLATAAIGAVVTIATLILKAV